MKESKKTEQEKRELADKKYHSRLATVLREYMARNPETGKPVTQKELAEYLGVRPQTVSLYCTGETLPNSETVVRIAEYFHITTDFLLTGRVAEFKEIRDTLGLSDNTIANMKLVNEGYFEDSPYMLPMIDYLLGSKDFYLTLEQVVRALEKEKDSTNKEMKRFYKWDAADSLQQFLFDCFDKDLLSIYQQLKN